MCGFNKGKGWQEDQKSKVILDYLVSPRDTGHCGGRERVNGAFWNLISYSSRVLGRRGNHTVLTRGSHSKQPANSACDSDVNSIWCAKQYCLQAGINGSLVFHWFSQERGLSFNVLFIWILAKSKKRMRYFDRLWYFSLDSGAAAFNWIQALQVLSAENDFVIGLALIFIQCSEF